jgi:predicted DNA-binding protein (MmcQ/YjbR family)
MFMMMNFEVPLQMTLKCDPELAIELREKYAAVSGAYHMNKTHWNTIDIDGSMPLKEILKMIDHSYELVVNKFTKKEISEYNKIKHANIN